MKKIIIMSMTSLLCINLMSCSSFSEVKAPCNYYGTFCGQKIRINHA